MYSQCRRRVTVEKGGATEGSWWVPNLPQRWCTTYSSPLCEKKPPTASRFSCRYLMARALGMAEGHGAQARAAAKGPLRGPQAGFSVTHRGRSPGQSPRLSETVGDLGGRGLAAGCVFHPSRLEGPYPLGWTVACSQSREAQRVPCLCHSTRERRPARWSGSPQLPGTTTHQLFPHSIMVPG